MVFVLYGMPDVFEISVMEFPGGRWRMQNIMRENDYHCVVDTQLYLWTHAYFKQKQNNPTKGH